MDIPKKRQHFPPLWNQISCFLCFVSVHQQNGIFHVEFKKSKEEKKALLLTVVLNILNGFSEGERQYGSNAKSLLNDRRSDWHLLRVRPAQPALVASSSASGDRQLLLLSHSIPFIHISNVIPTLTSHYSNSNSNSTQQSIHIYISLPSNKYLKGLENN